jgi:hypothetical protein
MEDKIIFQLGDGAYWLSVIFGGVGALVMLGAGIFALRLKQQDKLMLEQSQKLGRQLVAHYLENRTDFWTAFGNTILAMLLVVTLFILLLTKTISPEAGLPILSAIAGFAIARLGTARSLAAKAEPAEEDKKNESSA